MVARSLSARPLALVVDDDPSIRSLCAANLRLAGFGVLEADDGQSALQQARSARPDIVLSDVRMPRLDGFGLAKAMRRDARTRGIPLVFLSGETGSAVRARAAALGVAGFVAKPFDPVAVTDVLIGVLAQRGSEVGAACR